MSKKLIPLIVLGSVALARVGCSQTSANDSNEPQTPSEVAHFLADHGTAVQVPLKGKVKFSISKEAPTFSLPTGPSTVALLQLPEYQGPYVMTLTSSRRGIGRTTEIFIPSGLYFDETFQQVGDFGERWLSSGDDSLFIQIAVVSTNKNTRYILLYTRGDLVRQRVGVRATIAGEPIPGRAGTFIGSGFGIGRVERSLEGSFRVDVKPEPVHKK